jgi:YD repeat-containing protein
MKNTIITLGLVFLSGVLFGQTIDLGDYAVKTAYAQFKAKQVIPPSPEAAGLGKYGNVPVSLFTGSPQVSIPLVGLGTRYPLNISLSYNNSGLKPGESASWVGLGWNLNAGGVVTRSAMGNPDMPENYFGKPPIVLPPNNDLYARYDVINTIRSGAREVQPDVYFFNAGKLSGKFYIKEDGTVVKKSRDEAVISHCVNCLPSTSHFTITDDQGFVYEFKAVEQSYTVTDTQVPGDIMPVRTAYTYASAWYLTKITSPDNAEEIIFDYYSLTSQHTTINNNIQGQSITFQRAVDGSSALTSSTSFSDLSMNKIYDKKYLKTISVRRGGITTAYVEFVSTPDTRQDLEDLDFPGERLLNKVQLFQRNGFGNTFSLKQEFELGYSYFVDPNFNTVAGKRLRLDWVRENATDGVTPAKPAFQIGYNPFTTFSTFYMGVDHWGYANGMQNTTMIPSVNIGGQYYSYGSGGYRDANAVAAASGLIKSITYPTGGRTEFDWEPHAAFDDFNNLINPGGLRINTITDYTDGSSKASVKKFRYIKEDGSSSGKANSPNYVSTSSFTSYPENTLGGGGGNVVEYERWTISATPSLGLGSVQGSHVGYTRVVEEQTDITGSQPLGATVYDYFISYMDPNNDDIGNGDLLKTSVTDNGGKLLLETTNEYQYNNIGNVVYRNPATELVQDSRANLCMYNDGSNTIYEWRNNTTWGGQACIQTRIIKTRFNFGGYTINSQEKFLVRQTQKVFDKLSKNFISSVKNFTYGNSVHTYPTKIEQSSNNNTVVVNEIKYPKDYVNSGTDLVGSSITNLKNKNIVGFEVENLQYRQNVDGSNKRYINGQLSLIEAGIYPNKLYRLETVTPLTSVVPSTISGGQFVYDNLNLKQYASLVYDNVGNLIQQNKVSDMVSTYIWDHKQTLPTAEVVNAESSMVAFSSFESDDLGGFSEIPNLSTSRVAGGFSGGYAYNLSGGNFIKRLNLPAGRTYVISYWSKNGQAYVSVGPGMAPVRTDLNGKVHNGWTYYEHTITDPGFVWVSGTAIIDELKVYPADALINTIAYISFDGMTISRVDPSNQKADFDYDNFSRLVNIRDEDRNIVKNFTYQYGTANTIVAPPKTIYYNSPAQITVSRQGCVSPSIPQPLTYYVPYGKHAATTQQAAELLANNDIQQNAQTYANVNGLCLFGNILLNVTFYKNNCAPEQGPPNCPAGVVYTVPATKYRAASQTEANLMASNEALANGQNYANSTCTCSCDGPGKRYINGVCETGTMVYTGYEYVPNCRTGWNYRCFYYFTFSDGYVSPTYSACSRTACAPQ